MAYFSVRRAWSLLVLLGVLCLFSISTLADQGLTRADKLKAAYLFNFTKYLQWPADTFAASDQNIKMCLQVAEPMHQFIAELVSNRAVGREGRSIEVVVPQQTTQCHITYINHSAALMNTSPGVVVMDEETDSGNATIVFFMQGDKVRFDINLTNLDKLGVKASSELLKLSRSR